MKLQNNELIWADDTNTIIHIYDGDNTTVVEDTPNNYAINLNSTLNNLTKITTTDATIGNVKYPNSSSTQNKIILTLNIFSKI